LNAGEYQKAAEVLWLGLKLAWVTGVDALNQEWLVWKHAFLEVFDSAATYVAKKWAKLQNTLSKGIVSAMAFFDATINVDDVNAELDAMLQQQLATTDTAAAQRALELEADILMKATRVDGVYSDDPETNPHAILYRDLTYQQMREQNLRVMDATAISQCMEHAMPILVFNYRKEGNIERAVAGERVGTLVSGRRD
jgi:glutamate 5-kinase